jgi:secreted trypsin-like serine protease
MLRPTALACLIAACVPADAMVGGASIGENVGRSIVMIASSRANVCTGTALARDLVMTAAHCVAPAANYIVIATKGATPITTRTISVHPRYQAQSYANNRATADVALIKLTAPLPETIAVARLDQVDSPVAVGDRFVVAGFGSTAANSDTGIGTARTAALIATGQPGALQIRLYDPTTKGERLGLGACTGDSGAPAFRDSNGELLVAGIVSWSTGPKLTAGCGGLTGVTPLVRYRDWVVQAAGKLGSPL